MRQISNKPTIRVKKEVFDALRYEKRSEETWEDFFCRMLATRGVA